MKILISLFVIVMLTSCAAYQVTPYQKIPSRSVLDHLRYRGGFTETQLSGNVFRVSFRGNGYTGGARARDFSQLRAAELTLSHGFRYFIVTDKNDFSRKYEYGHRPRAETTIMCFKEEPYVSAVIYDAEFIVKSIKTKYGIGN